MIGSAIATVYAAWALAVYVLRGATAFEAQGVTFGGVILTYYVTGVLAGGFVGLVSPFVRSRIGAILVAWVAAFFVICGISMNMFGFVSRWSTDKWLFCAVLSLMFAVVGANAFWRPQRTPD